MEEPDYGNWVLRNCVGFAYGSQKMERNSAFTIAPDIEYCTWTTLDNTNPMGEKASSNGTSYSKSIGNYASEYEDLSYETAIGARQENGELPLKFGRLKAGSKLIDTATPITDFKTVDAHKLLMNMPTMLLRTGLSLSTFHSWARLLIMVLMSTEVMTMPIRCRCL